MVDIDTSKIDFERAAMLLDVVIKVAGAGPKLTSLGNAAMTELTKMNDAIVVASAEAKKQEEAEFHRQKAAEIEAKARQQDKEQAALANKPRIYNAGSQQPAPKVLPKTDQLTNGDPTKPDPDPALAHSLRRPIHPNAGDE